MFTLGDFLRRLRRMGIRPDEIRLAPDILNALLQEAREVLYGEEREEDSDDENGDY